MRLQRVNEPDSWEIRSWDASKRISVKLADHPLNQLVPHLAQVRMVDVKFEAWRLGRGCFVGLTSCRTLDHPLKLFASVQDGLLFHPGHHQSLAFS